MNNKPLQHQQGATLVVALVILGIMTVIGTASMQSSTLQERMASNARQKLVANQAAESALREAEQWIFANLDNRDALIDTFINTPTDGYYTDRDLPYLRPAQARPLRNFITNISDDDAWLNDTSLSVEVNGLQGDWARNPRVVIELLGQQRLGNQTSVGSTATNLDEDSSVDFNSSWVFRITAIGWSQNEDIYSVLRSSFITGQQFGG